MKVYGLVDCNSFFASCEKVFRPEWQNRPVVVLSNNDGCVIARSPEAKPFVAMGAPYFQVKRVLEQNGVVVRSSNFSLYGDMSRRVMMTLGQWTPDLEVYSVDEAFLDLTGRYHQELKKGLPIEEPLARLGREITEIVPRWTGIPVSVGIGPTKTLAKAANRIAKGRADRYCSLMSPESRQKLLPTLAIEDIWGVGRQLQVKLRRYGIKTGWDLAQQSPRWIREQFTITQEMMVRELQGEDCFDLETEPETPKSIRSSRSFGEAITTEEAICEAIASFAVSAAKRLRRQNAVASAVAVRLDTSYHRTDLPQAHDSISLGLDRATDDTTVILPRVLQGARSIFREGYEYKRGMVFLLGLSDRAASEAQPRLFDTLEDNVKRAQRQKLMTAIDQLNSTLGAGRVFYAAEGINPQWRPSAQFTSPCYTTRWSDIPVVKAK